jgi:hypothetical protein
LQQGGRHAKRVSTDLGKGDSPAVIIDNRHVARHHANLAQSFIERQPREIHIDQCFRIDVLHCRYGVPARLRDCVGQREKLGRINPQRKRLTRVRDIGLVSKDDMALASDVMHHISDRPELLCTLDIGL